MNIEQVKPLPGRLLVKQMQSPSMAGRFWIPPNARTTTSMSVVVATGPDISVVAPGDIVHLDESQGRVVKLDNQTYREVSIDHILSKLVLDDDSDLEASDG